VHWQHGTQSAATHSNTYGIAFTVVTDANKDQQETTLATDGKREKKDISYITCWNCNKKGHYSSTCPEPKRGSGTQMLMTAAAAGEFDGEDGVNFSFCLVTGRPLGMN
jgi:hypothetical protein